MKQASILFAPVARKDVVAFSSGVLLVLLALLLSGRVGDHGPACSEGLQEAPAGTHTAYQSTTYGWLLPAVKVEQIDCQGPPEQWGSPNTSVTWYAVGLVVALLELVAGGILMRWLIRRWLG